MWGWLKPPVFNTELLLHFLIGPRKGWGILCCPALAIAPEQKKRRKIHFGSRNGKYKEYLAGLILAK